MRSGWPENGTPLLNQPIRPKRRDAVDEFEPFPGPYCASRFEASSDIGSFALVLSLCADEPCDEEPCDDEFCEELLQPCSS